MGTKINLLIIGHAQHGKDTVAALMQRLFGLKYKGSSEAAAEIFLYNQLALKYGYKSVKECYDDRVNHRAEWYQAICEYNRYDPARLAKDIMILENNDIYVGMRDDTEIESCLRQKVFNVVVGVYNPRVPEEPKDSFNISLWDRSDIVIPNTGTIIDLMDKISKLRLWA